MMKKTTKFIALLSGAALLTSSGFAADSVSTDPVGYVTVDVAANSDLKVGVPLIQASSFAGVVDSVLSGTISVTSTVPDVTTRAHFVWVASETSALGGQWFEVISSTASSITVAEDLETSGLLVSESFRVLPFWTLSTLLPSGGGLPVTTDPSSIQSFVLTNNAGATGINLPPSGGSYFYFDNGSVSGWFTGGGQPADDVLISPESFLTLRNISASAATATFTGSVAVVPVGNDIVSRTFAQDNLVQNPYPADLVLGDSNLFEDGAVRATTDPSNILDFILVYPTTSAGLNPAASAASYFYFDNGSVSGYFTGGGQPADDAVIPANAAFIIRRGADADGSFTWSPPVPYSL